MSNTDSLKVRIAEIIIVLAVKIFLIVLIKTIIQKALEAEEKKEEKSP